MQAKLEKAAYMPVLLLDCGFGSLLFWASSSSNQIQILQITFRPPSDTTVKHTDAGVGTFLYLQPLRLVLDQIFPPSFLPFFLPSCSNLGQALAFLHEP